MRTIQFLKTWHRRPLRSRLWQGAFAWAAFIITFVIGNALIPPEKAVGTHMLGIDFVAFYTGGTFVHIGRLSDLYDLDAVRTFQHQTAANGKIELGDSFGPFWNPPFYAWVFVPLSALPFRAALAVWECISLACVAGALVLLIRMLPRRGGLLGQRQLNWRYWALVPALLLVSMPFIQSVSHGQNTLTSLLLLTLTVTAWRSGRGLLAGLVGGLLFYKPQLAAVIAVLMVLNLGWRCLLGLGITSSALLLINLLTLPGSLGDYLHRLPLNVHWMQVEHAYLWERHVTFKGFWRLLIQGRAPGEAAWLVVALTDLSCLVLGGCLLRAVWRFRKSTGLRRDRLICATIAAMPLLMPFYFDYDLLLLAVPAVLVVGEVLLHDSMDELTRGDRWMIGAFVALFAWMMINPGIAGRTHVNLSVILATCVASLLVRRALRRDGVMHARNMIVDFSSPPSTLAA